MGKVKPIPATRIRVETTYSGKIKYYPEVLEQKWVEHDNWLYVTDRYGDHYYCESDPYLNTLDEAKACIDDYLKDLSVGSNIIKYP